MHALLQNRVYRSLSSIENKWFLLNSSRLKKILSEIIEEIFSKWVVAETIIWNVHE